MILPEHFGISTGGEQQSALGNIAGVNGRPLAQFEKQALLDILTYCDGNIRKAARVLGISRPTICRKLKIYGLDISDIKIS